MSSTLQYDFTLNEDETVKQFEEKVRKNASGVSSFKVIPGNAEALKQAKQPVDQLKLQSLLRAKFQIEINRARYDVYPLFENMVDKTPNPESFKLIDKAFEGRSVPIARRVILYHFFDNLINRLK